MSENLIFLAGKSALSKIKAEGLRPDMVKIIAGAAGGPKWLVLSHLDRLIFSSWLKTRASQAPVFLIGSSIGAWRFAAVSRRDPMTAIEKFQSAYLSQSYSSSPTPEDVTLEMTKAMNSFLDDRGIREILEHPYLRLNIMAVRCKGLVASDKKIPLMLGMAGAALSNTVRRNFLKSFFERTLFYDPRQIPPFFEMNGFPIQRTPLTHHNIRGALLASGSIPVVMLGVNDIPGTQAGTYRDGGIIDYHFDIPFMKKGEEGIVLFPHYTDRIIPGWLDKRLTWRKPMSSNMDHVLLVSPSKTFIDRLPFHKIPDREDFRRFQSRDKERVAYWNTVIRKSRRLGEEFLEVTQTGKIRELVKPVPVR
ncbi:MAG TPA: patatin-like phospholipase family protein [Desulfobacterales bacterium]|nr:patatin-like phospholipase family protein [Desulfobacterales bacterium]